jgi:hypothetical protein
MRIETVGIAEISAGGRIKAIHEDGIEFDLQFEDGFL